MPTWTPSTPALTPQPVSSWTGGAIQTNGLAVYSTATYTPAQPVLGDAVLFRSARFGTLTNDCSLAIEFAIDDAAANFGEAQAWTNAQINTVNGLAARVPSAGKFYRFRLNPGTMTGANGLILTARS